nr:Chain C, Dolichyl-diphosphooligosaccharide--protein glycosyltransferase subunit WBP1 [Saccharomyces cerevisiae]4J86_D Chain D, Dolichyl-diphosphooligosaccharide--protein glycosyltransferase subunit WBP1 [Saccharomyces cerevisiae]
TFKKTN